jgi:hypothetical protein
MVTRDSWSLIPRIVVADFIECLFGYIGESEPSKSKYFRHAYRRIHLGSSFHYGFGWRYYSEDRVPQPEDDQAVRRQ